MYTKVLIIKFIYSEKATKFCEVFTNYLSYVLPVKKLVEILQNFVAFSEYMNFNNSINKMGYYISLKHPDKYLWQNFAGP